MEIENITLLTEGQIWGSDSENQLNIFEDYGTRCAITDFAILLGGYVSKNHFAPEGEELEHRTGLCWTASSDGGGCVRSVYKDGGKDWSWPFIRRCCIRPVLPAAIIGGASLRTRRGIGGTEEVIFGEYPQMVCPREMQEALERLYAEAALLKTGKVYTTDSRMHNDNDNGFLANEHPEYLYGDKKYIRVRGNSDFGDKAFMLSDGVEYRNGDNIWVQVMPVTWLYDSGEKIIVSKKGLLAGIRYNPKDVYDGNFENTEINEYLVKYFLKDIIDMGKQEKRSEVQVKVKSNKERNPFNFVFSPVREEEIIEGAIQSDISVFLHGQSSVGKSARVKQLDPDCHVIYLRNATPESLVGKNVYNQESGELIDVPPNWYKQVCEKCEKEPDKIHIVFFDEITNALYSIQGMAFNIVLDREVNGIWKLPPNCRLVAAGNDLTDSLAANVLVEPLFNRFAHVYIETMASDWLKWAVKADRTFKRLEYQGKRNQEHVIHPAIYAFIAYRRDKALRSEYTGEKPNADPRKWEMASRLLYTTKNPQMFRSLVGERIAQDFIHFCDQEVITVSNVINGGYNEEDLNLSSSEKFLQAASLAYIDEENLTAARGFMDKLGKEYVAVFDALYAYGDSEKLQKIFELRGHRERK